MTGKGSSPRPLSVSDEEFGKRFDAIDWSDARTPENDEQVIDTLMLMRPKVSQRVEVKHGVFPNGEPYTSTIFESNADIAAIDYAIGVMKANKP